MKRMKKMLAVMLAVVAVLSLAGCGKFDASAYVKALMDNSFKNDSTEFVKQKIGTKEEADKLYEEGLDKEITAMTASVDLSDELEQKYRQAFADMFKAAKYTVGEATENKDGSYTVVLKYQKMNVLQPAITGAMEAIANESSGISLESNEEIYGLILEHLQKAIENVTYEDEQEAEIKVEKKDNVYTVSAEDLQKIEAYLLDAE